MLGLSCSTWDLVVPDQGSNLGPLHWKCGVLATGLPGKSTTMHSFISSRLWEGATQIQISRCIFIKSHLVGCLGIWEAPCCGLNYVPPKDMLTSWPLEPHVTIFGYRVFADVIKLRWGHSGLAWALNPAPGAVMRRGPKFWVPILDPDTQTQDECHVTMEAETGMMCP